MDRQGRTQTVQISVQCIPGQDPLLDSAPASVTVRPGTLSTDDLQQLRRILHMLVTTARRTVIVDLSDVDVVRRNNVVAVLVGAAREARRVGSSIRVHNPPADQRRALFVAGVDEVLPLDEPAYEICLGTTPDTEALAV
jgi:anti-anti-sigma regulatory factor